MQQIVVVTALEVGRWFVATGDGADFESWARVQGPSLLRFAYLLCAGDRGRAEDIVQSSLSKVWLRWDRVAVMDSPAGYARTVVARELVSQTRLMSFGERPTRAGAVPDEGQARDRHGEVDDADAVWSLLRPLPLRQRAVLALRFGEDLSDQAIADVLGIRSSTARSQAARGLAALRRDLTRWPAEVHHEHR
jgi:RNA polymerase sigma-70 factor (sigma-E family)